MLFLLLYREGRGLNSADSCTTVQWNVNHRQCQEIHTLPSRGKDRVPSYDQWQWRCVTTLREVGRSYKWLWKAANAALNVFCPTTICHAFHVCSYHAVKRYSRQSIIKCLFPSTFVLLSHNIHPILINEFITFHISQIHIPHIHLVDFNIWRVFVSGTGRCMEKWIVHRNIHTSGYNVLPEDFFQSFRCLFQSIQSSV
jgi:hypothetical protein